MRFNLLAVTLIFLFTNFLLAQQDPEGQPDYFYVLCGGDGYSGSGVSEVCFKLRFYSDNTGERNKINYMAAVIRITGTSIVSVDTTVAKAYAGSNVSDWDIKTVRKLDDSDPVTPPFRMDYGALDFQSSITGDGLFVNVCVIVNDTGTICIDTTFDSDLNNQSSFNNENVIWYPAGWAGPFCCQIVECEVIPGDFNKDGMRNLSDLLLTINYMVKGGAPPNPLCLADINGDGRAIFPDIQYYVNYLFKGGPPPKKNGVCCLNSM